MTDLMSVADRPVCQLRLCTLLLSACVLNIASQHVDNALTRTLTSAKSCYICYVESAAELLKFHSADLYWKSTVLFYIFNHWATSFFDLTFAEPIR